MLTTKNSMSNSIDTFFDVSSYFPIATVTVGTIGNLLAFLIIISNKELRILSTMVYLAFLCIINTLSLIHWNLDFHFLIINYKITMVDSNMIVCKLLTFIQYTSFQIIGILNCLICIDFYYVLNLRYNPFRIGRLNKCFASRKSAVIWSLSVILFMSLINIHFIAFNGYWVPEKELKTSYKVVDTNGTIINELIEIKKEQQSFQCYKYPLNYGILLTIWDHVINAFYNYIPIMFIILFDLIIIVKLIKSSRSNKFIVTNHLNLNMDEDDDAVIMKLDYRQIKRLGISVLIWSILFLLMTAPTQIMFTFWFHLDKSKTTKLISIIMDTILYIQHGSIFYLFFITNNLFRKNAIKFFKKICCCCCCSSNGKQIQEKF